MVLGQIKESQHERSTTLKLTQSCFVQCCDSFLSTELTPNEQQCVRNCTDKFWEYYKRSKTLTQQYIIDGKK